MADQVPQPRAVPGPSAGAGPTPFTEAIGFFRQKVRLPTRTWTDLWEGMHARAFVVAGATKDALLADFQGAVQKALDDGTTLGEFRKDFDRIVATHGWTYRGSRGWRSKVIFDTNLRTSYQAGRWEQIQRLKTRRPHLRYVAVLDQRTRPEHAAWHGTVLPVDDAWWRTHYPPNGWRCRCTVQSLSDRDLKRFGHQVSGGAPPSPLESKRINTPAGPVTVTVPRGIDPGFAYNVGDAATGTRLKESAMAAWRRQGARAWDRLTPGGWEEAGRPATVPVDRPVARAGQAVADTAGARAAIERAIGGPEAHYRLPDGTGVTVNAETLAEHLDPRRAAFIPFLPEILENPFEVWVAFERHRGTGRVELRKRIVKRLALERDRTLVAVAQATRGRMEAWTVLPVRSPTYANNQRVGTLVFGR